MLPFGASDNTETDTGIDLPANLLVKDAFIRVTTEDATETLDFGILASEGGGDADGFGMVLSVATAGYVNMWPVVTNGSNIDYHVHTSGYGALLKNGIAGADAVATVGGVQRRYHRTDGTAKSISYTGSAGSDTAAGICSSSTPASRNECALRVGGCSVNTPAPILFYVQAAVSLPMDWNSFGRCAEKHRPL